MLSRPTTRRFLLAQTRRRAIQRVLPRDWPPAIVVAMPSATALDLAALMEGAPCLARPGARTSAAQARAAASGLPRDTLAAYPMTDFVADWYVLRAGRSLRQSRPDAGSPGGLPHLATRYGNATPKPHSPDAAFFARLLAVLATSLARMDRLTRLSPLHRHAPPPAPRPGFRQAAARARKSSSSVPSRRAA